MLKPLETEYRGRRIVLECTHKKIFPPPQMYGATDEDIDNLWRQGNLSQNEYQLLQTWQEKCHLMVMGPRCLDCPLALKQNPRPGRPHVIETEPWLAAKERMRWEDMKSSKGEEEKPPQEKRGFVKMSEAVEPPTTLVLDDVPESEPVPPPEYDEDDAPEPPEYDEDDAPEPPEYDEDDAPDEPEEEADWEVGDGDQTLADFDLAAEIAKADEEVGQNRPPSDEREEAEATGEAGELDDDIISALADD